MIQKKKTTKNGTKEVPRKARTPKTVALDPTSNVALMMLDVSMADPPDLPVDVAIAELASLARLGISRQAELAKVGVGADKLQLLARFSRRLATLQGDWLDARAAVRLSRSDRKLLEEAEALDAKLLAGGRWACREDEEALVELDRIAEGSGLQDTLQDLRDELAFWRVHADVRRFTDITDKDLKRAEHLVGALERAAEVEVGDADAASALALRNRCFWAADQLARTVREGGRYAFRLQPTVAAKFSSRYRTAAKRRFNEAKKKTNAAPRTKTAPAPAPSPQDN